MSNDNLIEKGMESMASYDELTAGTLSSFADYDQHQKVVHCRDPETGLKAFISVHNSNIGPALGGCRMVPYDSESDAIKDVLRLSRGMTYKNALAGLPLGGGKSVIIGNSFEDKTSEMMAAMGRFVESLEGLYITAEDSGTNEQDMIAMSKETKFVVGMPDEGGKLGGDPSPYTANGVYSGIKAAAAKRYGSDDMSGVVVSVQGLGAVGYDLCRRLYNDGAQLFVTDMRQDVLNKAQEEMPSTKIVGLDEIFAVDAQIFAPCALGGQLNDKTIPHLKVDIVAGAANNQLATASSEKMLAERNILYVPDYVLNAGGVIACAYEYFYRSGTNPFDHDLTAENMMAHVSKIGPTVTRILDLANERGISTARAADELAESIFLAGDDGEVLSA